ncbi:endonuclease [Flavobacterium urocaniciphilum]|uniref:Por secretion system C-terminal sorting domain-containing protein n=1 Tax=Flavobacterium urocaniciphilum TaxID=1299341 RepID=A0A1H8ZJC1_9FLAO|nr:endonuclease [Flavobacterium urocaniciphilum]SEP64629.1 Por secretion system C-terminal sorting domain-containing protein [Flavobacterium urocaniciphilum]
MKKFYSLIVLLSTFVGFAQNGAPASPYYNGMNWSLTGMALKSALETKITTTHTKFLTYSEVWNACQATDLDPTNSSNVLLVYGFSNNTCPSSPSDDNDHRSRDKFSNGGATSCEWNREHVYAKSLGTPALDDGGASDAGEDAHHLRSSDVDRNNDRASEKFVAGSGNSHDVTASTWYPGDEWKGDIARMMMYMYLRYPTQCLPINVGNGNPVANDSNMIDLFLQWNAEDPVSQYEDNRNTYHGNTANTYAQGNRNPFIDNPYLATVIWGGPAAQNRWPSVFLSSESFLADSAVSIYPNPTNTNEVEVYTVETITKLTLVNVNGQVIKNIENPIFNQNTYKLNNLPQGFYFLQIESENGNLTKKVIVN